MPLKRDTVFDKVMYPYLYQQYKHDLGEGRAERDVNNMTNVELLEEISRAIEERIAEEKL